MENVFQNIRWSLFVAASILAFASKPQGIIAGFNEFHLNLWNEIMQTII